jgi:hypothetical protein
VLRIESAPPVLTIHSLLKHEDTMNKLHLSSATPRVALFNDRSIQRHSFFQIPCGYSQRGLFHAGPRFGCHGNGCPENSNLQSSVLHRQYLERSCRSSVRHLAIETLTRHFIQHFSLHSCDCVLCKNGTFIV